MLRTKKCNGTLRCKQKQHVSAGCKDQQELTIFFLKSYLLEDQKYNLDTLKYESRQSG
jgi:hypothetical protein